ncbi:MAG: VWA domain-containing protein [Phaeodactylibacter sp.]|nr:VWA domain-containing protein [Phaeodactylibacter sp.]MCB9274050.1 VWA domain-containing protein [Lewinellaceae bacterium]
MKNMRTYLSIAAFSLLIALLGAAHLTSAAKMIGRWVPVRMLMAHSGLSKNLAKKSNLIQVALLLDTSNSMDGLIEQAKSQLWSILGELSRMKKEGETPELEIALYEYGNLGLPQSNGYIRQATPFTKDMDLVSEMLFALDTHGGDEFCGQVIHTSLQDLEWGAEQSSLRLIYIAGNEPFTQGAYPYAEACSLAKEKGVIVNTIFCGELEEGIAGEWKKGADIALGAYAAINQGLQTAYVESPFDSDITRLNEELNQTYLPFGEQGVLHQQKQVTQDANAVKYGHANMADRASFKASKQYSNDQWDLVDAYQKDKTAIRDKEALPENMKAMSQEEIEAEIQRLSVNRAEIQQQILQLNDKRRAFIQERDAEKQHAESLENSILKSLREQARAKGFVVE